VDPGPGINDQRDAADATKGSRTPPGDPPRVITPSFPEAGTDQQSLSDQLPGELQASFRSCRKQSSGSIAVIARRCCTIRVEGLAAGLPGLDEQRAVAVRA
jgi:hypothetical protein